MTQQALLHICPDHVLKEMRIKMVPGVNVAEDRGSVAVGHANTNTPYD